jgi:hypothetical protein
MTDFINFWLAKAYVDFLLALGVIGFFVLLVAVLVTIDIVRNR